MFKSRIMIPKYINCKSKEITHCNFYIHKDCPEIYRYARKMKQGISHTTRTGLERFLARFPFYEVKRQKVKDFDYLGIGAMVLPMDKVSKLLKEKQ